MKETGRVLLRCSEVDQYRHKHNRTTPQGVVLLQRLCLHPWSFRYTTCNAVYCIKIPLPFAADRVPSSSVPGGRSRKRTLACRSPAVSPFAGEIESVPTESYETLAASLQCRKRLGVQFRRENSKRKSPGVHRKNDNPVKLLAARLPYPSFAWELFSQTKMTAG